MKWAFSTDMVQMKIVHVVYSLKMGGAEILVRQLCRLQRAEGHDVSVYAYAGLGMVGEAIQADGVEITVLGEAHPLKTMARYHKIFRTIKPDVVHCHNQAATTHGALPARLAGVRRVITTRHRVDPPPYDPWLDSLYSVIGWFCDAVVGICETTCEAIRRAPLADPGKVVRVYNGVDPVARVYNPELGKSGFLLLFIGRVDPEKDLGTLIRAAALASPRVPGLELWIVGDGRAKVELEALVAELGAAEQVRFWGQRLDTAQFFSAADAFVMSSLTEGLPMSLLQAMSLGTPAILTDVDGGAEVTRTADSGLLVPVRDPAAFAQAIVQMVRDPELRARLSANAQRAYRELFTLEHMGEGYMRLYRYGLPPD